MTAFVERLRALPRRWTVVGGTAILVSVVVIAVVVGGHGSAQLTIADSTGAPPSMPTTTTVDRTTTTTPSAARTTTTGRTNTVARPTAVELDDDYRLEIDDDVPAVEGRTVPDEPSPDEPPPVTIAPPVWAASTRLTAAGQVATDVGCADDLSSEALDLFLSTRVGPVLGWDYQHVYPLGDDRYLWLFQDAFLDHSGTRTTLGTSRFIHNAAMVQDGTCFTLMHRGLGSHAGPVRGG